MIHEPADNDDPCCEECLAWAIGEDKQSARDYVAQYMGAKFTPEELEDRRKATADWLDDQPCGDGLCECDAP